MSCADSYYEHDHEVGKLKHNLMVDREGSLGCSHRESERVREEERDRKRERTASSVVSALYYSRNNRPGRNSITKHNVGDYVTMAS